MPAYACLAFACLARDDPVGESPLPLALLPTTRQSAVHSVHAQRSPRSINQSIYFSTLSSFLQLSFSTTSMTAATAYPPAAGGSHDPSSSGVRGGLRFRMRPVQAALLFAVVVLLLSPAFIGEDRRDHLRSYVAATIQKTGPQQITQPTGGLDPRVVPLTLEARLEHFLSRPALDHGESEIVNAYQCPHYTFSRDTYFFHEADGGARIERWKKLDKNAVKLARSKIVEYFKALDKKKVPLIWNKSMEKDTPAHLRRGIIYTGGGHWVSTLTAERREAGRGWSADRRACGHNR